MVLMSLSACGLFGGNKDDEARERARALTEKQLYEKAQDQLDRKSFDLAVQSLQLLESRFPFGVYAEQAQLEIIYAYFKSSNEEAAVSAAERFIRLHPAHPEVDYAWYMKGLASYPLAPGMLSRFYDRDFSARDIEPARQSFREFQEFLRRYPESQYAADARVRMVHIRNILARHEVLVANYYVKRKAYVAALNRAKTVLEKYQKTEAMADALALQAYCYSVLGLEREYQENLVVLKLNFPQHPSFTKTGEFKYGKNYERDSRSLLNRLTLGGLDAPSAPKFDNR